MRFERKKIDKPERIFRKAKAIASDIHIYNKDKIEKAIREDNFLEAIEEELLEATNSLLESVDEEAFKKDNYLERAIVDIILKYCSNVESKIW